MQQGQNKGHCSSSPTHWLSEWLKWQVNKFRRSCTEKCNFTWTPRCSSIERKIRQVRTLDLVTSIRMTSWAEGIMTQGITVQWLNLSGPKLAFKNSHSLFFVSAVEQGLWFGRSAPRPTFPLRARDRNRGCGKKWRVFIVSLAPAAPSTPCI